MKVRRNLHVFPCLLALALITGSLAAQTGTATQDAGKPSSALGTSAAAQQPSPTVSPSAAAGLQPIAWMVGDWHATAAPPNGPKTEIDNHITWSDTKTALLFTTRFNGTVHYQGMYAYDPAAKKIRFVYVDTDGNLTQGTAEMNGERLFQQFTGSHMDGTQQSLVSYIDRKGADVYHWQVLKTAQDTKPLIELDYTRTSAGKSGTQ